MSFSLPPIVFVGGGNMASAIAGGLLRQGAPAAVSAAGQGAAKARANGAAAIIQQQSPGRQPFCAAGGGIISPIFGVVRGQTGVINTS